MTTSAPSTRRVVQSQGSRRVVHLSARSRARRALDGELVWWWLLLGLDFAVLWAAVAMQGSVPLSIFVLPLALATILLGPRRLPWFVVVTLVALSLAVWQQDTITARISVGVLVIFVYGLVILLGSFRRSRLGVSGIRGESMLVDLRDRIIQQGRLPSLPAGWSAESVLRSAGGTPFAGDFVVATQSDPGRLDLAVVDVSGKGEAAGTRALMLSGALGGLLGALPPARFLPAANEYLLRQGWEEGFATAVHLTVDLHTGDFEIRTAGHPPALHLQSGSGRWQTVVSEGPVLGLIADAEFLIGRGRMQHGDALMLYTDGLVETPQRDLTMGIDRLRGRAERLMPQGLAGGAEQLVEQLGSANDDCALLMLHRA